MSLSKSMKDKPDMWILPLAVGGFCALAIVLIACENIWWEKTRAFPQSTYLAYVDVIGTEGIAIEVEIRPEQERERDRDKGEGASFGDQS